MPLLSSSDDLRMGNSCVTTDVASVYKLFRVIRVAALPEHII